MSDESSQVVVAPAVGGGGVTVLNSQDVGAYLDVLSVLDSAGQTDDRLRYLSGPGGRLADHLSRVVAPGGGLIVAYSERQAEQLEGLEQYL